MSDLANNLVSGEDNYSENIDKTKESTHETGSNSNDTKVSFVPSNIQNKNISVSGQSPTDISLSLQTTLRYCDVEEKSVDQSDYIPDTDTVNKVEDASAMHEQPQFKNSFYEKLSVTCQNLESTVASLKKPSSNEEINIYNSNEELVSQSMSEPDKSFDNGFINRPESLFLPHKEKMSTHQNLSSQSEKYDSTEKCNVTIPTHQEQEGACSIDALALSPNFLQGTVERTGEMISFVADNLEEKIKLSSPLTHTDGSASSGSRRSSVRSIASASASSSPSFATSSGISHSPSSSVLQQSPDDIPPIDAQAVLELENHAQRVADSLDLMMGNIRNNLHKMSAITIGCQDAYKRSVDITCDSVDTSIKTMYALMAKCEELSFSMGPVEQLAGQIREIKRILDLFEIQLTDK